MSQAARIHPGAIGATAGSATVGTSRERKLEAKIEQRLDRALNRLLGVPQLLEHHWQLATVKTYDRATWSDFTGGLRANTIAVTTVEHEAILAIRGRLRGGRFKFYWCSDFPWSRLQEVATLYERVWRRAEETQSSGGRTFFDSLAAVWGGQRFCSRDELTALENSTC